MFNLPEFDLFWLLPIIIVFFAVISILRGAFNLLRKTTRKLRGEPTTKFQIQERLQDSLNFSAADLEHNRTFRSATFRQRLRTVPQILWGLGIVIIFGYFFWTNIIWEFEQEAGGNLSNFVDWVRNPQNFLLFVVLGLMTIPMLYRSAVGTGEFILGTLYSIEGEGSKFVQRSRRSSTHHISIDGVGIKVPSGFYQDFIPGHSYRAYYFPQSKNLASIEIVKMKETDPIISSETPEEVNKNSR